MKVNPAGTSQDCSGCGERVEKDLGERTHSCPFCGLTLCRDENAARNIERRGRAGPSGMGLAGGTQKNRESSPFRAESVQQRLRVPGDEWAFNC